MAVLLEGGCGDVIVVLGAAADEARALLHDSGDVLDEHAQVRVVLADDWAEGMSRSLRTGLAAVPAPSVAALVHLVDLPDVSAVVVQRVLDGSAIDAASLARATYLGQPGHPVLIGMDHVPALIRDLDQGPADAGARHYLGQHRVHLVECGDLATGQDQDGLG